MCITPCGILPVCFDSGMKDRNRKVEIPVYYTPKDKLYTLRFTKEFLPHFRNLIRVRADLIGQRVRIKIYRRSKLIW